MRLHLPCVVCWPNRNAADQQAVYSQLEPRDDNKYFVRCEEGHEVIAVLQNHRFEILFEAGANALVDGYPREAAGAFAASLERFYEYAMKVLLHGVDPSGRAFEDCWKEIKRSSERQLGAFLTLWTSRFKSPPDVLSEAQASFRNAVVHKGKFPSSKESIDFGEAVRALLCRHITKLRDECPGSVRALALTALEEADAEQGAGSVSLVISTIVSVAYEMKDASLSRHLERIRVSPRPATWATRLNPGSD